MFFFHWGITHISMKTQDCCNARKLIAKLNCVTVGRCYCPVLHLASCLVNETLGCRCPTISLLFSNFSCSRFRFRFEVRMSVSAISRLATLQMFWFAKYQCLIRVDYRHSVKFLAEVKHPFWTRKNAGTWNRTATICGYGTCIVCTAFRRATGAWRHLSCVVQFALNEMHV
jgi:hypothetical protein